jgi:hypothetical protein
MRSLLQPKSKTQAGQSMVELALIGPLLILMLLGVFEVGYVLRGYLVLVNANREAARFTARGRFVNFDPPTGGVNYQLIVSHTLTSLAGQIDFRLDGPEPNGTILVSHYYIDTGFSCDPPTPCNCSDMTALNTPDERIRYPGNTVTYTYKYSNSVDLITHFPWDETKEELRLENEIFNCTAINQDPTIPPSVNSVIIVEMLYRQDQLLGAPLISQIFPDPVPLYASTTMRISADARSK